MATVQGYRLVAHPSPGEDVVPYSSLKPDVEGDLVTEPNSGAAPGPLLVFTDFARLALNANFTALSWFDAGNTYSKQRLLVVEWDDGDVIATKDLGLTTTRHIPGSGPPLEYVREAVPWYRHTVTEATIGDEITYGDCGDLCILADGWEVILGNYGIFV